MRPYYDIISPGVGRRVGLYPIATSGDHTGARRWEPRSYAIGEKERHPTMRRKYWRDSRYSVAVLTLARREFPVRLRNVTFSNWVRSHSDKHHKERWLREWSPGPILAKVDCDPSCIGQSQPIPYDGVDFDVTLKSVQFQVARGTYRYRLFVESSGLGWHARSYSDEYDMCGSSDGNFVTVFHNKKEEPLEKIAKAFFSRQWNKLNPKTIKTLTVSRFLAATIAGEVAQLSYPKTALVHYPLARLFGAAPMLAEGESMWIGYRFFSEDAYAWARRSAGLAEQVVCLYFADTKYQFRTDLPAGVMVHSVSSLDSSQLAGSNSEFIRILLRGVALPNESV